MRLFTIGFTKKRAREFFFTKLVRSGVKRVVDVRLRNTSGLSGFSKKDDLKYFLEMIGPIEYIHLTELARHRTYWTTSRSAKAPGMFTRQDS